ncbi:hypothetical protein BVC80_8895g28 [Macleaya cordata]|uniref:Uncharacterized protein n=1 Tax=Macleaya cordata TaxID=56857 RepID=A0A200Q3W8_MACCD|nr:hypothetical protein BVC80_8895g28 [Macleaya cordata]
MAHSLAPSQPSLVAFSTRANKRNNSLQCLGFQRRWSYHQSPDDQALNDKSNTPSVLDRRTLVGGLAAAVLSISVGNQTANVANRRPPPPPPQEKKDPNVSGVQAKVLASIKRKEAMKEAVAKLREEGKAIDQSSK